MSSRRTSRRAPKKAAASLPTGVLAGLSSLVEGNESTIAQMLSVTDLPSDKAEAQTQLQTSLADCMAMNDLSAEALLARFFDSSVLSRYCQDRLGVSGKGNEAGAHCSGLGQAGFRAAAPGAKSARYDCQAQQGQQEEAGKAKLRRREREDNRDNADSECCGPKEEEAEGGVCRKIGLSIHKPLTAFILFGADV